MPLRKLPGWLMTLQPSRVAHKKSAALIRIYQEECDDVLWRYWTQGHAVNPRVEQPPLFEQSSYPAEWSQDAPHKLEQARKCAKGTYEITKNDVLPLLKQILGVLDERGAAQVATQDFAQIRDRLAHLMAQFAAFDQVLRPAVRAEHIMLRPLKNLADMVESLRQSLEQRGNMPAEMMIVRMAADTIQGITPNKGVEPSASVAGKILARAPRAPRVGA